MNREKSTVAKLMEIATFESWNLSQSAFVLWNWFILCKKNDILWTRKLCKRLLSKVNI
jgi:hypothetical protein